MTRPFPLYHTPIVHCRLGDRGVIPPMAALRQRFVNMGVCEQNMISIAAGLARQGLLPLCYSIAPFAVFRPYEQLRLDIALNNLPVRIVGNGGGYGYGIMGASHHALEDLAVLSALPYFTCIVPLCNTDVAGACGALSRHAGPAYLRLGYGAWPAALDPHPEFKPIRRLVAAQGALPKVTVAGIGPVLLNTLPWIAESGAADVFAVSQLPLPRLDADLLASVRASGTLWVIEEHGARGGLGEHLASHLGREGIPFRLHHRHATGYPEGRYGSQAYHQRQSGLDSASLQTAFAGLTK